MTYYVCDNKINQDFDNAFSHVPSIATELIFVQLSLKTQKIRFMHLNASTMLPKITL